MEEDFSSSDCDVSSCADGGRNMWKRRTVDHRVYSKLCLQDSAFLLFLHLPSIEFSVFTYHRVIGPPVLKISRTHFQSFVPIVQELLSLRGRIAVRLLEEKEYPTDFAGILTVQCIVKGNLSKSWAPTSGPSSQALKTSQSSRIFCCTGSRKLTKIQLRI